MMDKKTGMNKKSLNDSFKKYKKFMKPAYDMAMTEKNQSSAMKKMANKTLKGSMTKNNKKVKY